MRLTTLLLSVFVLVAVMLHDIDAGKVKKKKPVAKHPKIKSQQGGDHQKKNKIDEATIKKAAEGLFKEMKEKPTPTTIPQFEKEKFLNDFANKVRSKLHGGNDMQKTILESITKNQKLNNELSVYFDEHKPKKLEKKDNKGKKDKKKNKKKDKSHPKSIASKLPTAQVHPDTKIIQETPIHSSIPEPLPSTLNESLPDEYDRNIYQDDFYSNMNGKESDDNEEFQDLEKTKDDEDELTEWPEPEDTEDYEDVDPNPLIRKNQKKYLSHVEDSGEMNYDLYSSDTSPIKPIYPIEV